MSSWRVVCADVLDWAAEYDGPKFHAMLCDPPYELAFMGKSWDAQGISFQAETWAALAQHLHPGAWIMAFASSRGWHRLAVAIEDAGLIIQPSIFGWATGQSFPKATRIDTQIDKRAGKLEEREAIGTKRVGFGKRLGVKDKDGGIFLNSLPESEKHIDITAPATPLARAWVGHRYGGQVLKDALNPIICAQKPWTDPRLDCIVETGAGALNVDGGRIGTESTLVERQGPSAELGYHGKGSQPATTGSNNGRWPANFTLQHSSSCCQVLQIKNTNDAVKYSFRVTIIEDSVNYDPAFLKKFINGYVSGLIPGPIVVARCIYFNDGVMSGEVEVNDKGAACTFDDELMNKINAKLGEPVFDINLGTPNSEDAALNSTGTVEGHIGKNDTALEQTRASDRTANVLAGRDSEPKGLYFKLSITNGTGELDTIATVLASELIGALARTSGASARSKLCIGDAVDGLADGASPIVSWHIITSKENYTILQRSCQVVANWSCVSECVVRRLGEQSGERRSSGNYPGQSGEGDGFIAGRSFSTDETTYADKGTAARFFYQSDWGYEREESCQDVESVTSAKRNKFLHAADLEAWIADYHPAIFSEWELGDLVEWVDFWDWLGEEYPEIFEEFRNWFKSERQEKSCQDVKNAMNVGQGSAECLTEKNGAQSASDIDDTEHMVGECWSYEIAERLALADPVRYQAKSARAEREAGLFGIVPCAQCGGLDTETHVNEHGRTVTCRRCDHPTVKPIALNIWLCRLLAPPPEYAPRRLLVPFAGSGSEIVAAILSGCWEEIIGIELSPEYVEIARARCRWWQGWSQQAGTTEPKEILKASNGQPEPEGQQLTLV